jgi:prepilin-type N-terminal cleavage/methylation domain-containing protein
MKQNPKKQSGFTLIELIVVISIMLMAFGLVLTGLNQQRIKRSVNIAQNETTTNIRKVQSYMLSSRNIGSKPVKYYIVQFKENATTYTIRAVDSDYTYYPNVETVRLTDGVVVFDMVLTDRTGLIKSTDQNGQCAQLIFAAPFGKVYMDNTSCDSGIIQVLKNPVSMVDMTDAVLDISLKHPNGTLIRTMTINGFSNKVIAN